MLLLPATARARLLVLLGSAAIAACAGGPDRVNAVITADGSSTVYPLTEAVAEDFQREYPDARVTIGVAGTGGGLRRFCRGDLDLANASRPISRQEAAACAASGVRFLEIPIAYDGIVIAVHPSNTWVESLSVADLRRLWRHEAEGRLLRWSDLRPGFPDREVHLFGAGADSGTFDYFTGVVTGAPRDSRGDYTSSEDDNTLVQGVAGDAYALGYFGYAYYEAHRDYVRAVPILVAAPQYVLGAMSLGAVPIRASEGTPAVAPTPATIRSGAYRPLSRPVFVYVNVARLERPHLCALVEYYVTHAAELAGDVGYVALDARVQAIVKARVAQRVTGSLFLSSSPSVTLAERLGER